MKRKFTSEIQDRDLIVKQFKEWWTDDDIRNEIIPSIVEKRLKNAITATLKNYLNSPLSNKKKFAEILYDLVGQNFLVNKDSSMRFKFLGHILKAIVKADPSFQNRFLKELIIERKANKNNSCKTCNIKWERDDDIFEYNMEIEKKIFCANWNCVFKQLDSILKISDEQFIDIISNFRMNKSYFKLCNKLIDEINLPKSVMAKPNRKIKLLPTLVEPAGTLMPLYDYQSNIGSKIREMLEKYEIKKSRRLVVLPTGAGKTRLVAETLIEWINSGKPGKENSKFILWIVDRNELCQQAFDEFNNLFKHKGKKYTALKLHPIYEENEKNIRDILNKYHAPISDYDDVPEELDNENGIVIASIQSLYSICQNTSSNSLGDLGKYTSIVIIDEAHHAHPSSQSYTRVLRVLGFDFKNIRKGIDINKNKTCLLGLTATPFRGADHDGKRTRELLNRFGGENNIIWPAISYELANNIIPPTAYLYVQEIGFQSETIKMYGENSYTQNLPIIEYNFIISKIESSGDIIIHEHSTNEKNIEMKFDKPGTYKIKLVVKDEQGNCNENYQLRQIKIIPRENIVNETVSTRMQNLYKHLIKRKILAKPHHYIMDYSKIKIPLTNNDLKQFNQFHDITDRTISEIGNDPQRNKRIIDKISSLIKNENIKSILFFACSISHAQYISFELDVLYGIKSASIDHMTSPSNRSEILENFRARKISVLCNYGILSTGFDSPKVECVFIARPTFSHLLYNQMTGRGLRGSLSGGTHDCIIVDISDNIQLIDKGTEIEQPWKLFDYIYETSFDESIKKEQDCFCCFGNGKKRINGTFVTCTICNGTRKITPDNKSKSVPNMPNNVNMTKLLQQMQLKHPDWDLLKLKREVRRNLKYDEILHRYEFVHLENKNDQI